MKLPIACARLTASFLLLAACNQGQSRVPGAQPLPACGAVVIAAQVDAAGGAGGDDCGRFVVPPGAFDQVTRVSLTLRGAQDLALPQRTALPPGRGTVSLFDVDIEGAIPRRGLVSVRFKAFSKDPPGTRYEVFRWSGTGWVAIGGATLDGANALALDNPSQTTLGVAGAGRYVVMTAVPSPPPPAVSGEAIIVRNFPVPLAVLAVPNAASFYLGSECDATCSFPSGLVARAETNGQLTTVVNKIYAPQALAFDQQGRLVIGARSYVIRVADVADVLASQERSLEALLASGKVADVAGFINQLESLTFDPRRGVFWLTTLGGELSTLDPTSTLPWKKTILAVGLAGLRSLTFGPKGGLFGVWRDTDPASDKIVQIDGQGKLTVIAAVPEGASDVVVAPDETMYVTLQKTNQLAKLTPKGALIIMRDQLPRPSGLAFVLDRLTVTLLGNGTVFQL